MKAASVPFINPNAENLEVGHLDHCDIALDHLPVQRMQDPAIHTTLQENRIGTPFAIDPIQLGLTKSGGRPLPGAVRTQMETALGEDFSDVRVHIGPEAERLGAIAFAIGSDIYFAPGHFQPETLHGQWLLGHELAHVVQQRQGRVRTPSGSEIWVVQDSELEAEADRLAAASTYFMDGALPQANRPSQDRSPAGYSRAIQCYIAVDATTIEQPGTNHDPAVLRGLYNAFNTKVKGPWRFSSDLAIAKASDSKTIYLALDHVHVANFVTALAKNGTPDTLLANYNGKTVTYTHCPVDATLEADCGHVAKKVMGMIKGLNPATTDDAGKWTVAAQRLTLTGNTFSAEQRRFPGPDGAFYTSQDTRNKCKQWLQQNPQQLNQGWPFDELASPPVGCSYVIMPDPNDLGKPDVWNWHWGAVVAESANDKLTLEGYAGVVNATGKNWYFEMYSTNLGAPQQTFHRRNELIGGTRHFGQNPMTFVASDVQK